MPTSDCLCVDQSWWSDTGVAVQLACNNVRLIAQRSESHSLAEWYWRVRQRNYFTTRRSTHLNVNWDGVKAEQSLAPALRYLQTRVRPISFLSGSTFPKFWFINRQMWCGSATTLSREEVPIILPQASLSRCYGNSIDRSSLLQTGMSDVSTYLRQQFAQEERDQVARIVHRSMNGPNEPLTGYLVGIATPSWPSSYRHLGAP